MMENTIGFESMQSDHSAWSETRAKWRREMQQWQGEHEAAVARLADLQRVIRTHGESLAEHLDLLTQTENAAAVHDRQMAEYASGNSRDPQDVLANRHQEQACRIARHQEAHERIRKHHESVMAQLRQLESAATSPM